MKRLGGDIHPLTLPASTPLSRLKVRQSVALDSHPTNIKPMTTGPLVLWMPLAMASCQASGIFERSTGFHPSFCSIFLLTDKLVLGLFHSKLLNGKPNAYRIKANFLKGREGENMGFVFQRSKTCPCVHPTGVNCLLGRGSTHRLGASLAL